MKKILKWTFSFIRLVRYKIYYREKLKVNYTENKKPIYLGANVRININQGCIMEIGGGSYISDNCSFSVMDMGKLIIGNRVYFGEGCKIFIRKECKIGKYTLLANNVSIYDHNHIYENSSPIADQGYNTEGINIGSNNWLSANVVVTKGSKLEDRCIVGANAVVRGHLTRGVYVLPEISLIKELGD